jgi:hypothetical protein
MQTFHVEYRCPDIMSQEDAEMVREALIASPGIGDVDIDWRTKLVKVTTSNQDGGKSVLAVLLTCGFPPEE